MKLSIMPFPSIYLWKLNTDLHDNT
jgi:hypothetical protein